MNFIEPTFEWLIATTLRATAMAVAILAVQFMLRRWLPPQWRHALWLPFLIVLALPVLPKVPFGIFPQKVEMSAQAPESPIPALAPATSALPLAGTPVAATRQVTHKTVNPWAITWLAGSVIMLGIGITSYQRNMRRIRSAAVPLDAALSQSLAQAASEAGLRRKTHVIVSKAVESPAVTGLLRPTLLLPAGFPAGFSESQARLILLHEFTHLKRLDLPVNWLSCLFQAMHWFNPILWFAFARLRADRESACDAQVLSLDQADHRSDYGHALLKLQSATPQLGFNLGFVGIFERNSELKTRIRDISMHRKAHPAWRAAGLTLIGALTLLGATEAQERKTQREKTPTAPEAKAPKDPRQVAIEKKLDAIVIPMVKIEDSSIEEVIDFLRLRSRELDKSTTEAAQKGVNFVIRAKRGALSPRVTALDLKDVTLRKALENVAELTGMRLMVDPFAVSLVPQDAPEDPKPAAQEVKAPTKAMLAANKIIIPIVDIDGASLEEVVDFLNLRAKQLAGEGAVVPPVTLSPKAKRDVTIQELRLRNVPLGEAVRYVAEAAKQPFSADDEKLLIGF